MQIKRTQKSYFSWVLFILLIIIVIILISLIYFIFTYYAIQTSKNAGFAESKNFVLEKTDLTEIQKVERFQELDEYHIVFGKTEENIEQMIYVPISNQDEELTIVNQADIIKKEQVEKQWSTKCKKCKLVSIKPAILNHTPLWELTYYDESNRYVFDYVLLNDGSEFEKVRLQRKFK